MTKPISTFTVPVAFRGVAYDVEITPLMNGKTLPLMPDRIEQWNLAEKTHRLFSTKIEAMLQAANVPAERKAMLTLGSAGDFTFADAQPVAHTTADLWDDFIKCIDDPASHIAGMPKVDEDFDSEESGREVGPGVIMGFSHNLYRNLTPAQRQTVQFDVFEKKCEEHFCMAYNISPKKAIEYDDFEKACLHDLLYRNPAQPKMDPQQELNALWRMQNRAEQRKWSLACDVIKEKIAAAAAALEDEESESIKL